jgi:hypothetical protein
MELRNHMIGHAGWDIGSAASRHELPLGWNGCISGTETEQNILATAAPSNNCDQAIHGEMQK